MCEFCTKKKDAQKARDAQNRQRGLAVEKSEPIVCEPIWHKNQSLVTVRCYNCLLAKKGCSFKDYDWGVAKWPKLVVTDAAPERRAKEAEVKRKETVDVKGKGGPGLSQAKGKGSGDPSLAKEKVTGASSSVSQITSLAGPGKEVFDGVEIVHPKREVVRQPTMAPSLLAQGFASTSQVAGGSIRSIFLEDILEYEAVLSQPSRTPLQVWMKAVELRAMCYRERGESRALIKLIEGRRCLIDGMIERLAADARQLAEGTVEEGLIDEHGCASTDEIEALIRRDSTADIEDADILDPTAA